LWLPFITRTRRELLIHLANGLGVASLVIGGVSYLISGLVFNNFFLIELLLVDVGLFSWRI